MSTQGTEGVYRDHDCGADGHTTDGGRVSGVTRWTYAECAHYGCPVRIVIDPEDREQVERWRDEYDRLLITMYRDPDPRDVTPEQRTTAAQAALRSLIAPPNPDEPRGLGAVVQDEKAHLWFRMTLENQTWPGEVWQEQYGKADRWSKWVDVVAVRVLSEGWTA